MGSKRAEKYAKEYQDKERDEIRLQRDAKKEGNYYVAAEPKLAFVMRIRYQPGVPQGEEGAAAAQTEADQQRRLHQDEQGDPEHAENLRALHHLRMPQPEVCP